MNAGQGKCGADVGRSGAGRGGCMSEWMQGGVDAGQGGCRAEQMQGEVDAGRGGCRAGWM